MDFFSTVVYFHPRWAHEEGTAKWKKGTNENAKREKTKTYKQAKKAPKRSIFNEIFSLVKNLKGKN